MLGQRCNLNAALSLRERRSNSHPMRMSLGFSFIRQRRRAGQLVVPAGSLSVKMSARSTPSSNNATCCLSACWSLVDTRAQPYFIRSVLQQTFATSKPKCLRAFLAWCKTYPFLRRERLAGVRCGDSFENFFWARRFTRAMPTRTNVECGRENGREKQRPRGVAGDHGASLYQRLAVPESRYAADRAFAYTTLCQTHDQARS